MERFSSLSHVPAETRRLLRDRLRSSLPSYRTPRMPVERAGKFGGACECKPRNGVAARLWDRSPADPGNRISALRLWVDRWQAIAAPSIVPSRVWSGPSAEAFRESALEVIGSVAGLE